MKTVYLVTLDDSFQAGILRNRFEEEGIEIFIKNDALSSVINTPGFQMEVEVYEIDYERAFEILKEGFPYLVKE